MRLNKERTVAELDIQGSLTVSEVETLISRLAELRANMLPPVADAPPSAQDQDLDSHEISVQANPAVELRVLTEDRIRVWIRNLGIGWLAFDLAPDTAESLARFILSNLGERDFATGFFSEHDEGRNRSH